MNCFDIRNFFLSHLILMILVKPIENQVICQSIYYADDRTLKCELYNKTDPPDFKSKEIMKNCTEGDSLTYPDRTKPNTLYLNNGYCILKPGYFTFLRYINIENFSSRSKNTVLGIFIFSGLCNLQYIDLSESGIEIIHSLAFTCVRRIKRLYLSNNKIEHLAKNVFKGMRKLQELHLNGNRIRTFDLGTFDNTGLETLDLHNNSIYYLPDGIFRRLRLLKILNLARNKLKNLSSQILADLTGLQDLKLSNNELKCLSDSFSNNYNLMTLSVDHNFQLNITSDAFSGLVNLHELHMSECNLKILPRDLLSSTPELSWLNLTGNKFEVITTEMFSSLKNLEFISLSSNNIAEMREPFRHNENMKQITLAKNKLSVIKDDDFRGLMELIILDLSSNSIENIAVSSFNGLSLVHLNLSHNLLTSLPGTSSFHSIISNATELQNSNRSNVVIKNNQYREINLGELNMNENPLILNNDSFLGLNGLNVLSVQKCNITYLPGDLFKYTTDLGEIDLYGNNLNEITQGTFGNLHNLIRINITSNNISILKDRPFKKQTNLKILSMGNNKISEIKNDHFEGLSSLTFLDISRNTITLIGKNSFDDMGNLETLNLQHNQLISLSVFNSLGNNIKLRKIDISHNKLTGMWVMNFEHLKELEVLTAAHNEMTELLISEILPGNKYLKIHLESNRIRHIHACAEQKRDGMKAEIYLSGNPLQCDCHNYALYRTLNGSDFLPHVKFADGLICQSPLENKGKSLNKLKPTDFTCNIIDGCPHRCICPYSVHNYTQSVNCNSQNYSNLPTQAPFNTSVLYIKKNSLTSLSRLRNSLWENLTELYADYNLIESEELVIPKTLKMLSLQGNKLKFLPNTVKKHAERVRDFKISVSNNSWTCDCSLIAFKTWLRKHLKQVTDISEVRCVFPNDSSSTVSVTMMEDSEFCPAYSFEYLIVVAIVLMFLLFYYKYKLYILSFIYTHCSCFYTIFCCDRPKEEGKIFDCFISYGANDRVVTIAILQELEAKPPNYKFCIHERNWMPGRFIANNIIVSVQNSRNTLLVLSESFLKSQWFQLEFQAAYYQTLEDKVDRLIIVVVGDMPDKSRLSEDVAFVISWKTYLVWGEKWFWEKLRYALYAETSPKGKDNKCSTQNMLNCFRGESVQNPQSIRMSED